MDLWNNKMIFMHFMSIIIRLHNLEEDTYHRWIDEEVLVLNVEEVFFSMSSYDNMHDFLVDVKEFNLKNTDNLNYGPRLTDEDNREIVNEELSLLLKDTA